MRGTDTGSPWWRVSSQSWETRCGARPRVSSAFSSSRSDGSVNRYAVPRASTTYRVVPSGPTTYSRSPAASFPPPTVRGHSFSARTKAAFWRARPPSAGRSQTAQRLARAASSADGRRSGAYGMPIVAPCGGSPLSRTFSSTVRTLLPGFSSSLAEAMLSTGCSWALPSVLSTT